MYADDAVIFIHGKNQESCPLNKIQHYAKHDVPTLKTVCMMFTKMTRQTAKVWCIPKWGRTGISIPVQIPWSHVKLESDVQKTCRKTSLTLIWQIRPFVTVDAVQSYLHGMIFGIWLFACTTPLKPIKQLQRRDPLRWRQSLMEHSASQHRR